MSRSGLVMWPDSDFGDGNTGSLATVTYYVREQKRRTKEVFVPLSHRLGHAQVDFGETLGVIGGVECKIHFAACRTPCQT